MRRPHEQDEGAVLTRAWGFLVPLRALDDSRVHSAAGIVPATGTEPKATVKTSARRDEWPGLPGGRLGHPGRPQVMHQPVFQDRAVVFFRTFVNRYGWGYDVREHDDLVLPAYAGPLDLPNVLP